MNKLKFLSVFLLLSIFLSVGSFNCSVFAQEKTNQRDSGIGVKIGHDKEKIRDTDDKTNQRDSGIGQKIGHDKEKDTDDERENTGPSVPGLPMQAAFMVGLLITGGMMYYLQKGKQS